MSGGARRDINTQKQIIPDDKIREVIQQDKPKELVEYADQIAEVLVDERLTTSQIRSFFNEVRLIQGLIREKGEMTSEAKKRLFLLKPKLAYQTKRHGRGVARLEESLKPAIDCAVESKENVQRFVDFFEAILAYHQAKGGN